MDIQAATESLSALRSYIVDCDSRIRKLTAENDRLKSVNSMHLTAENERLKSMIVHLEAKVADLKIQLSPFLEAVAAKNRRIYESMRHDAD